MVNGDQVAGVISSAVSSVPNFVGGMKVLINALNFDSASPDALASALRSEEHPMETSSSDAKPSGKRCAKLSICQKCQNLYQSRT